MLGNKKCEVNKCVGCQCKCIGTGGHSCDTCDICTQQDNHARK